MSVWVLQELEPGKKGEFKPAAISSCTAYTVHVQVEGEDQKHKISRKEWRRELRAREGADARPPPPPPVPSPVRTRAAAAAARAAAAAAAAAGCDSAAADISGEGTSKKKRSPDRKTPGRRSTSTHSSPEEPDGSSAGGTPPAARRDRHASPIASRRARGATERSPQPRKYAATDGEAQSGKATKEDAAPPPTAAGDSL
jgi:hypothetical protein